MSEQEILNTLCDQLGQEFMEDLLPFWTKYAVDEENGGFVGRITFDNQKIYDSHKGGILNARLLWAFSAAYNRFKLPELEEAAKRTYSYFKNNFVDKKYGGFFWMIDAKGNIVDDKKHIYTQAFGIYGLVEYYSAFKDREALKLAYNIYALIEKHAVDNKYGGYFEAYSREWKLNDDVRLSAKDKNVPKSMNTHLHILEAYTNLYRYAPTDELKIKLEMLIEYFCKYIINNENTGLINFFDVDWTPKSSITSYGHDIEASWLLVEAAEVLKDKDLIKRTKNFAVSIAEAVYQNGVDSDGALINEAKENIITDSDKDWWPQVEAIIGFLNAYEISGDSKFLDASYNSWEFIKTYMIDKEKGEWFEKVSRDRVPYQLDKVRSWKGPYHNMRAILEVITRVDRIKVESLVEIKSN
tara:strand:+ start:47821 stop:49056 length:1236 start_codon:yes stop_codon:yes gene_type:complete